jgi:hypothetical protein
MLVKDAKKNKPLFRFDTNGEYVTEDAKLIQKLKVKFKFEEVQLKAEPLSFSKKKVSK